MYNLLPFRNLYDFLTAPVKTTDYFIIILKNILGNIVLFLPFGFFLPALFSKCANFKKFFLITLLTLFIVELLQFLTMLGAFDINDIVLNLLGAIVGFLINKSFKTKRLFNKQI
jgi:glycopeptide antibiotics resistance protein